MINNNNFYRDFDLLFSKLKLEKNETNDKLYNELICLYEKNINYLDNTNIILDLDVKSFKIDNNGIIL
jgi:hypothetical protein|tara:strand:+ start:763 stop:966 length:204 start_codon:yes stop_codon:yes gene_type:complete